MSEGKDRLKQIRNALGMSQPIFSQYVRINNSTINHIENGNQKLSVRVALALRDVVVQTPDGRLRIVTAEDPRHDDEAQLRIDWLVAGEGEPFDKTIQSTNSVEISLKDEKISLPKGVNIEFFKVCDEIMSPEFIQNDYVAIDTNQTIIKNGGVYLISVFDDCVLRRIFKIGKDKLNIIAVNKDLVPSFEIGESEITVIGRYIYKVTVAQN